MLRKATQKLREVCEARDVRVTDLIHRTGFSRSKVSAHVNGKREPDFQDRRRYEEVLRLPEMYLEADLPGTASATPAAEPAKPIATPMKLSSVMTALNAVRVLTPKQLEELGTHLTLFASDAIARGSRGPADRPARAAFPSDEPPPDDA